MPEDIASSCMVDTSRRVSPFKPRFEVATGRFDKDTPILSDSRQQNFNDHQFFSHTSQRQCFMEIPVSAELKGSLYRPSNLTSMD
jgi:hypothetical protein